MEIIVQGSGVEYFTPDEAILDIHFYTKGLSYEEVLRTGINSVQVFIDQILLPNGFKPEDMKTRSFVIKEEQKYNQATMQWYKDGFSYNQSARLKFDYNKELIARIMASLSSLANSPECQISFGVKDEKGCKRAILAKAYQDAELQARAIADASGKILKYCEKVDFKPFTTEYVSNAIYGSDIMYADRAAGKGAAQTIVNTFTPEDIELSETLYCLWIAE